MAMVIRPEVARFLQEAAAIEVPDYGAFDATATAAHLEQVRRPRSRLTAPEPVARVEERVLGPDRVPIRIYWPEVPGPLPVLVYFHGGGWVTGDLEMHDPTCRSLARLSRAVVVNVGYRLAPEFPYPGPLEDCYAAVSWVRDNAADLGVDRNRVGVAGSSSGGNLAAAVALLARDRGDPALSAQVLIYPVLDLSMSTESYRRYGTGYFLERTQMAWYWRCYLGDTGDGVGGYASPLQAPDLTDLAPAIVVLPEYDPLRDEGVAYADRLTRSGVQASVLHFPGQIHGFIALSDRFPDDAADALRQAAALSAVHLWPAEKPSAMTGS